MNCRGCGRKMKFKYVDVSLRFVVYKCSVQGRVNCNLYDYKPMGKNIVGGIVIGEW